MTPLHTRDINRPPAAARTGADGPEPGTWTPRMDVLEGDLGYTVTVDLPGVAKEDVRVTVERRLLSIAGERRGPGRAAHCERPQGNFALSIRLDKDVDAGGAKAAFANGVLAVTIPKAAGVRPRTIPVAA